MVGVYDQPISGEKANVIVGDLQAASTLLSAGIREAHTLVLAGADDALNLAILMQARILKFNTSLGDRLDQTLPDHVTMSVAALAAPVFAFDALGNQAIGQLQLFNQTWSIHEEYLETNCQTIHGWDLLDTSLSAGDILYLTMPATGLEQLWRAAPSQLIVRRRKKRTQFVV